VQINQSLDSKIQKKISNNREIFSDELELRVIKAIEKIIKIWPQPTSGTWQNDRNYISNKLVHGILHININIIFTPRNSPCKLLPKKPHHTCRHSKDLAKKHTDIEK